jgi:two-component sensor histidine kinase
MILGYFEALEALAKSKNIINGEIETFAQELLRKAMDALKCNRTNIWVFKNNNSELSNFLSFQDITSQFTKEASLFRKDLPKYFSYLEKNEVIISNNAEEDSMHEELVSIYLNPNSIVSLIDIPLRSDGEMIGVVCFESTFKKREWKIEDQKFALSIASLISLAMERAEKIRYQEELERAVKQKEILLSEMNHRVKNNLSLIIGLINLQSNKAKSAEEQQRFRDLRHKLYSIARVQENLHGSSDLNKIELHHYLHEIVTNLNESFGKEIAIDFKLSPFFLDITKAIPCGLIANEAITNSYKFAFNEGAESSQISISSEVTNNEIVIVIEDNGSGFIPKKSEAGLGMELMTDLAKQIDGSLTIDSSKGTRVTLSFPV